jgi:hypothetical protein
VGACYETFFICILEMADVMLAKPRAAAVIALENFMMLIFHGVITCGMRDLVVGGGLADGGLSIDFKRY